MAIAPLQVWDDQGRMLINFSTRIARQLGAVWTGTSDGSIYVPELAGPDGWIAVQALGDYGSGNAPMIARSGGTISWRFVPGQPNGRVNAKILYGVR
ncbi:hypothetical protein C1I89_22145 [Achromobacter pulmonis]|uniref:Uncharacterized protein n=1 Tax=Achromobacter pulmonis TaxID=1389932 RepID=A0A2N8KDL2_9BURK|nr:hypothetical protein [Achromobacter pulmonis]PND31544.1 hypothetical protein C1I89_22145 [Achromobacter pulmonis]